MMPAPAANAPLPFIRQPRAIWGDDSPVSQLPTATLDRAGAEMAFSLLPFGAFLLDRQRDIVYANAAAATLSGAVNAGALLGRRTGDVFDCEHAFETAGGCGTTEACTTCGGFLSIQSAQRGQIDCQECRISTSTPGAPRDLRMWTRPLQLQDELLTCVVVADISAEKRRDALERTFFHDVLNSAGALHGLATLLTDADPEDVEELKSSLVRLSGMVVDELKAQRDMIAMEKGELAVELGPVQSGDVLVNTVMQYSEHQLASGKKLVMDDAAVDVAFVSDAVLVGRVIGNMVKNALEATARGGVVSVGCDTHDDRVRFWVHNQAEMPRKVQLQMFQRSFTTKGRGRGIGTYSMRLLSHRYLRGRVWFTSSAEEGTTFFAEYPTAAAASNAPAPLHTDMARSA